MPTDGEGATLDEIEQLVGADRRKWHKPLAKLIKDELVKRSGDGNRYSPYRHLRAPDAAVPHSRPYREDGGDGSTPAVHPSSRPMGTADERRAASTQPSTVPAHGTDENSDIVTARTRTEPDPDAELERLRRKGLA
jgi:hypothetical protein